MKRLLIYVAGPYTASDDAGHQRNVDRAMDAGRAILELGHYPLIPHLTHYFDLRSEATTGERLPWQLYMAWDRELLLRCDAFLYLAPSRGTDTELRDAVLAGMPIYRSLDDVPDGLEDK